MSTATHSRAKQTPAHSAFHRHTEPAHTAVATPAHAFHGDSTPKNHQNTTSKTPNSKPQTADAISNALGFWANQSEAGTKPLNGGNEHGSSQQAHALSSTSDSARKIKRKRRDKNYHGDKNPGGKSNIHMNEVNPEHQGKLPPEKRTKRKPRDAARIAQSNGGKGFKLKKDAPILADDGNPICRPVLKDDKTIANKTKAIAYEIQKEGKECRINAGAIKKVGANECVFVFTVDVKIVEDGTEKHITDGQASGWIDIRMFHDSKKIHKIQRKIKNNIEEQRGPDKKIKLGKNSYIVDPVPAPDKVALLHTCPKQKKKNNLAQDYYAPKSAGGNAVLLLVNLPGTGPDRFGVGMDLIARGASFQEAKRVNPETCFLYATGREQPVDKDKYKLVFVFGRVTRPDIPDYRPSYGWINKDCLKET